MRIATGRATSVDGGVPHGEVLRCFAAAVLGDGDGLDEARAACVEAVGASATVQAASIIASFDGINRVADATGIRLDAETAQGMGVGITEELELGELAAARA